MVSQLWKKFFHFFFHSWEEIWEYTETVAPAVPGGKIIHGSRIRFCPVCKAKQMALVHIGFFGPSAKWYTYKD